MCRCSHWACVGLNWDSVSVLTTRKQKHIDWLIDWYTPILNKSEVLRRPYVDDRRRNAGNFKQSVKFVWKQYWLYWNLFIANRVVSNRIYIYIYITGGAPARGTWCPHMFLNTEYLKPRSHWTRRVTRVALTLPKINKFDFDATLRRATRHVVWFDALCASTRSLWTGL